MKEQPQSHAIGTPAIGGLSVHPIGVIRTPFQESAGTPIQPSAANGAEGIVELFDEFAPALADVDGFERVWLLYWFHRALPPMLCVTPFLDATERGLFATRAPCRPNPIGLSCVRLLAVEGRRLRVADVDVLDNTPLLDIKPYIPDFDSFPVSSIGWLGNVNSARQTGDDRFEKPTTKPGKSTKSIDGGETRRATRL